MVEIREEAPDGLAAYAAVPIAFAVHAVLRLEADDAAADGWARREEPVAPAWEKDYDALDGGPLAWLDRFDVRTWGLLGAFGGERRVGGAAVAWNTPGLDMLGGRADRAVLWDLRVDPRRRRRGVGRALFDAAASWARARGCTEMHVETQDVNVPACRFYEASGCRLLRVEAGAYPSLPAETKLVWGRPL